MVAALDCGTLLTKDCPADVRYRADAEIGLPQQSVVWQRLRGLYKATPFHFSDAATPCHDRDGRANCPVAVTDDVFPYTGYLNVSIRDTRYRSHVTWLIRGTTAADGSYAAHDDTAGHSSWDKNGTILLLEFEYRQHPRTYPDGQVVPVVTSHWQPVGERSAVRTTVYQIGIDYGLSGSGNDDAASAKTVYETWTCRDDGAATTDCSQVHWTLETFDVDHRRIGLDTGILTRYTNESQWRADMMADYERAEIPVDQRRFPNSSHNMSSCLVPGPCFTDDDFCRHGDPACGHAASPYQDDRDEGQLSEGVLACIIVVSFFIVVALMVAAYVAYRKWLEHRYRTLFVQRLARERGGHFLGQAMKEISAQDMAVAFNAVDRLQKGYITQGELTDYMNGGETLTLNHNTTIGEEAIPTADLARLWDAMDVNGTGDVSFLEFCMFLADSHREHAEIRHDTLAIMEKHHLEEEKKRLLMEQRPTEHEQ